MCRKRVLLNAFMISKRNMMFSTPSLKDKLAIFSAIILLKARILVSNLK